MKTVVTSRHFKAHQTLVDYVSVEVEKLSHFYDGILRCDVVLSYEKARNSRKIAEVKVAVYGAVLTAISKSEDFFKSIDIALAKVLAQLKKYKAKLRARDRRLVRAVKSKV